MMFIKTSENQCNFWHITTQYSGTGLHYFFLQWTCSSLHEFNSPRLSSIFRFFCSTVARPFFYHQFTCCVKFRHSFSKSVLWRSRRSYPISTNVRNILHQQQKSDFLQMFLSISQLSFRSHRHLHAVFSFVRQSHYNVYPAFKNNNKIYLRFI